MTNLKYKWGRGKHNAKPGLLSKIIPRRNIIIETANTIINKQGKSVTLDFLTNCSELCQ